MFRFLFLLLLLLVALAAQAPAWLLAQHVNQQSAGMVELRNFIGSVWSGSADAFVPLPTRGAQGASGTGGEIALGRVQWKLAQLAWQRPHLVFVVEQTPAATRPARLSFDSSEFAFAGSLRIPAAVAGASRWLAGWSVSGAVQVDSESIELRNGYVNGTATATWRNAVLVPPDLPAGFALGTVVVRATPDGAGTALAVTNQGGDAELKADGSLRTGQIVLQVQPRATATPVQVAWLRSHLPAAGNGFGLSFTLPRR